MEIIFLTLEEILDLHQDQIDRHGGDPSVRDLGLLQSAAGMPAQSFAGEFLHEFPHGMAAAYLFHLVQNHPFVDGNKRTGLASALTFLDMNDLSLDAGQDDVEKLVLAVASGQIDKPAVVEFFGRFVRR